jgi:hypothetical protein
MPFLFLTADILDWNEEGACDNVSQKYDTIIASDCVVSFFFFANWTAKFAVLHTQGAN